MRHDSVGLTRQRLDYTCLFVLLLTQFLRKPGNIYYNTPDKWVMRLPNHSMVRFSPSSILTCGCHPKICCALVIFGRRRSGSSIRCDSNLMVDEALQSRIINCAKSNTVNSSVLPRLNTSPAVPGLNIASSKPSTRSLT